MTAKRETRDHGDGGMAALIRAFDWAATPTGPPAAWPQSLRTAVDLMLAASQPAYIAWGPELTLFYNDGIIPYLGARHPGALGLPFREVWPEIWDEYRPLAAAVMRGEGQHFVDRPIPLAGRPERPVSWFTFSWTPLRDDTGTVAGLYCAATETTEHRLAEQKRRQREAALREGLSTALTQLFTLSQDLLGVASVVEGRWHRVNPAFGRTLGWREDELLRTPFLDLVHPDDLARSRAAASAMAADGSPTTFTHRMRHRDGSHRWIAWSIAPRGDLLYCVGRDVTDAIAAEAHLKVLLAELDHRVKNVLAVVQSIARQSLRDADPAAADRFLGRLSALARSHAALAASRWEGARLFRLIADTLAPHGRERSGQIAIQGPDLRVLPNAAQSLALAVHELATNAAKYGALSTPEGRLDVAWTPPSPADGHRLTLAWRETGGPPIPAPPTRRGFGSMLIERTLSYELDGTVDLDFAPTGLVATVVLPPSILADGSREARAPLDVTQAAPAAPSPGAAPARACTPRDRTPPSSTST